MCIPPLSSLPLLALFGLSLSIMGGGLGCESSTSHGRDEIFAGRSSMWVDGSPIEDQGDEDVEPPPLKLDLDPPLQDQAVALDLDSSLPSEDFSEDLGAYPDLGLRDETPHYLTLSMRDAVISGSYSVLSSESEELYLLDSGAQARWSFDDELIPLGAEVTVAVSGRVWRYEDGLIHLRFGQQSDESLIWGDGRLRPMATLQRYTAWRQRGELGYGAEHRPPALRWSINAPLRSLELEAEGGGLIIKDVIIYGADAPLPLPPSPSPSPSPSPHVIEYHSCALSSPCDDGAELTSLIASAPLDPLEVRLISSTYHAQTPVIIQRSHVTVVGSTDETPSPSPIWRWSPLEGSGQSWPFILRGSGRAGDPLIARAALEVGQRTVEVNGPTPPSLRWVQLSADDFGEVPPVCLNGRDVERRQRHQRQLFEVISAESISSDSQMRPDASALPETITRITLDRAIPLDIPLTASPHLIPISLVEGITLRELSLEADCPEAWAQPSFNQASCANSEVIDDGGVLALYTESARLDSISTRGFGKFSLEVRDSLRAQLSECQMSHPSAYGSGGQGYGVHLIGASRTVISGEQVHHARHGVVVDFGSSDSQIIEGNFSEMNQALIDVHGEASRDTLIRANELRDSSIGVIIGGGGRVVHCNDGPRHHVLNNHVTRCGIGVSVSDYTEQSYIRSNTFEDTGTHVAVSFGGREVWAEYNLFGSARVRPLSVGFADTSEVQVNHNLFTSVCDPEVATLVAGEAEPPTFSENLWCPDDGQ